MCSSSKSSTSKIVHDWCSLRSQSLRWIPIRGLQKSPQNTLVSENSREIQWPFRTTTPHFTIITPPTYSIPSPSHSVSPPIIPGERRPAETRRTVHEVAGEKSRELLSISVAAAAFALREHSARKDEESRPRERARANAKWGSRTYGDERVYGSRSVFLSCARASQPFFFFHFSPGTGAPARAHSHHCASVHVEISVGSRERGRGGGSDVEGQALPLGACVRFVRRRLSEGGGCDVVRERFVERDLVLRGDWCFGLEKLEMVLGCSRQEGWIVIFGVATWRKGECGELKGFLVLTFSWSFETEFSVLRAGRYFSGRISEITWCMSFFVVAGYACKGLRTISNFIILISNFESANLETVNWNYKFSI